MILNSKIIGNDNKKIVVLHGLYGSSDSWTRIGNILSQNYTVHLLDLRNHGKSFHHPSHTYLDLSLDLKNYAEYHNLTKFYLIGHSMGGKTAMFFSDNYPNLIDKLIVADISPRNYTSLMSHVESIKFHMNLISLMKTLDLNSINSYSQAANILNEYDEIIVNLILKNLSKTKDGFKWKLNVDALFENLPNIMSGLSPDDYIDRKIKTPVLFLKAENSNYINQSDEKLISFIFTDSKIELVKNAGHWLHIQQPLKIAEIITEFFK